MNIDRDQALKLDGFDDCIIGISSKNILIYDEQRIIERLAEEMTEEDALEYYSFNIECAYMGEGTPIYMRKEEEEG